MPVDEIQQASVAGVASGFPVRPVRERILEQVCRQRVSRDHGRDGAPVGRPHRLLHPVHQRHRLGRQLAGRVSPFEPDQQVIEIAHDGSERRMLSSRALDFATIVRDGLRTDQAVSVEFLYAEHLSPLSELEPVSEFYRATDSGGKSRQESLDGRGMIS
ncbi:hypothetical protein D3C71_420560 [compost metagenome]